MANVLGTLFSDIASAIKAKNGEQGVLYKPAEFPAKIRSIKAGTKDPKLLVASGEIKPTTTDAVTIAHNLGVIPDIVLVFMAALDETTTISASTLCVGGEVAYSSEAMADGATRYLYSIMGSHIDFGIGVHASNESAGYDLDATGIVREATPRTFKWGGSKVIPVLAGVTYRWIAIGGIKEHPAYLDVICSLDGMGNLIITGGVPAISQFEIYVDGTLAKTVDYVYGEEFVVYISDVAPMTKRYTISVKAIGNLDSYPYQFSEPVTGYVTDITMDGPCGDNATFNLDDTGTLTIRGTGAMWNYTNDSTSQPWTTRLGAINKVVIEDGITHVGEYAFRGYTAITSVEFGKDVTTLGRGCFLQCAALVNVRLPSKLTTIGSSAFNGTAITAITIPYSVTLISAYAFNKCPLTSATFERKVTWYSYEYESDTTHKSSCRADALGASMLTSSTTVSRYWRPSS